MSTVTNKHLLFYLKQCNKETDWKKKIYTEVILSKDEMKLLINELESVDKLKNEIKQMVEERLTEAVNKINNLKQEKANQEALQECCTDSLKLFVANTDTTMANIVNPLNPKVWAFDRGLY